MTKKQEPLFHLTLIVICLICQFTFGQAYNSNWNKTIELALARTYGLAFQRNKIPNPQSI
jgi:hypothetical protein